MEQEISDEDFNKLGQPDYDLSGEKEKANEKLVEAYRNIIDILKEYLDLREDYYNIIALWIIGTYLHDQFPSYPYLFLNAMKGSGKTRTLKLITYLAKEGQMLNSLTQAVLFRTTGTLAIDEFEGIGRKGIEDLRELLNSAYKKGTKVKRMRKAFSKEGEQQVVEEFNVYRPIVIANISGMESVLSDRCITLVLEKSNREDIVNLIELFEFDEKIIKTKALLEELCNPKPVKKDESVKVVLVMVPQGMYRKWNNYIKTTYTNNTNNINNATYTNDISPPNAFKSIKLANINGRELELCFPLLIISDLVGEIKPTLTNLSLIMNERRQEDLIENTDISLYDFVSQQVEGLSFVSLKDYVVTKFREHLQSSEDWINPTWMGRALKRLNLIKEKRRKHRGVEVILDIKKAQEKMKMFR